MVKFPSASAGGRKRGGFDLWLGKSPGVGNDNPVKQASILAWEIPRAEEPGGLQSVYTKL